MSKEEILKIQTCVLKVNIHCDGCKHKVKKILQKIDGVYTTNIDSEQGKVTVSGNVDPATLIKKLTKSGKYAELWGVPKANQNQKNQLNNQFKNMQIDINGKGGNNNKGQTKGGNNQQPKGGQAGQNMPQQVQELQQIKGFHGLKLPQFKDLKFPFKKDQKQKSVKFKLPEDGDLSDDEYDDYDDDDDYDDEFDDELDIDEVDDAPHHPFNKMKPPSVGNGSKGIQMPNMMMNGMMGGQHPQFINAQAKGGNIGGIGGGNAKKSGGGGGGGGGNIPIQVNGMGSNNGGKKGGGGDGGGGAAKNGGKNGGGLPSDVKIVNHGGGSHNKLNSNNGNGGGGANGNLGKKGGGMDDGIHGIPHMNNVLYHNRGVNPGGNVAQPNNMPMGQMNQLNNMPLGQMSHVPAVQGLPAMAMNAAGAGGGGGGAGYFNGAGPEVMAGNPYYQQQQQQQQLQLQQQQQQLAAMMMNQQRANGNERFQPMMYARPPPAINYVPPYHPYQYPPPSDSYTHYFNDENTSSCNVM